MYKKTLIVASLFSVLAGCAWVLSELRSLPQAVARAVSDGLSTKD